MRSYISFKALCALGIGLIASGCAPLAAIKNECSLRVPGEIQPTSASDLKAVLSQLSDQYSSADINCLAGDSQFSAKSLHTDLVQLRLQVHRRLPELFSQGWLTDEVRSTVKTFFTTSRHLEETAGEFIKREVPFRISVARMPVFGNAGPDKFQGGDILMQRGLSSIAAAIGQAGDGFSAFSHLAFVHQAEDGSMYVVDSVMAEGARVVPLFPSFREGTGRSVLLRARDPVLRAFAREAARRAYEHISAVKKSGGTIDYDFSLDENDSTRFFCSEIIGRFFREASGGGVVLPVAATNLGVGPSQLLSDLGIQSRQVFAPGDMEIDPRFYIVLDWYNTEVTALLRTQDLVVRAVFDKLRSPQFAFVPDGYVTALRSLAANGEALSLATALEPLTGIKVPQPLNPDFAGTIYMLNDTIETAVDDVGAFVKFGEALTSLRIERRVDQHLGRETVGYLRRVAN